jgi:hypothetical protein
LAIDAASGVETVNWLPSVTALGTDVMVGRGASDPDPSFANRYGGLKISAFLFR